MCVRCCGASVHRQVAVRGWLIAHSSTIDEANFSVFRARRRGECVCIVIYTAYTHETRSYLCDLLSGARRSYWRIVVGNIVATLPFSRTLYISRYLFDERDGWCVLCGDRAAHEMPTRQISYMEDHQRSGQRILSKLCWCHLPSDLGLFGRAYLVHTSQIMVIHWQMPPTYCYDYLCYC